MAIYTLKNQYITIQISSLGAELASLKENQTGTEYMWCADPQFWGRTSPVLFPIVGACKNNEITYCGKNYPISQHGFARDMEFNLISQSEDSIWFALEDTEATREKYPFAFRLELGYHIAKSSVEVLWRVKNPGQEKMYFSIGGHPAFRCPLEKGQKQTDYAIAFDAKDKIISRVLGKEGVTDILLEYPLEEGCLSIVEELFDHDALIIENHQAHKVSLMNPAGNPYLTVTFDAPLFGIWSPPKKNAPFICIEPWYGRADHEHFTGELKDREWGNELEAGETFEASYCIAIGGMIDGKKEVGNSGGY